MPVDTNKFHKKFRNHTDFKQIIEAIDRSPLLVDLIDRFSGTIKLGKPGEGSFFLPLDQKIIIDEIDIDTISHTGDPSYLGRFVTGLAHELGHAVVPGGTAQTNSRLSLTDYVLLELRGEGIAILTEYQVANELGAPMWSSDESNDLQPQLDAISAKYNGSVSDPEFVKEIIVTGARNYANENPSGAPNLNYKQFYSTWYVLKYGSHDYTGEQIDRIDWLHITPQDVSLKTEVPGRPREFVNPLPLTAALTLAGPCISVNYRVQTRGNEAVHYDSVRLAAQHFEAIDASERPAVFRVEQFENGRQNLTQVAGTTRAYAPIGQEAFIKTVKAVDLEFRAALATQSQVTSNLGPSVDSVGHDMNNRPVGEAAPRPDHSQPRHRAPSESPSFNCTP